jgi:hypothetical protein
MATLKTTLVLGSEEVTSVVDLITSIKKDLAIKEGGILVTEIDATTEGTAETILTACDYVGAGGETKIYVYLKNKHATNTLKVKLSGTTDHQITLAPGEAAFFPWLVKCTEENPTDLDIKVFASGIDTTLEYGAFN